MEGDAQLHAIGAVLPPLVATERLSSVDAETHALLQRLPGRRLLVTGGCGFIGSSFIRCLLQLGPSDLHVYNMDSMEYCAVSDSPLGAAASGGSGTFTSRTATDDPSARYHFVKGSILSAELVLRTLRDNNIDMVVHMAAQTHVDNSFADSLRFTQVNVVGTHTMLECARQYGQLKRFLHISTDEVYGETCDADEKPAMEATTVLRPTNPYAATKAAAEHLVLAYFFSFRLPVVVSRGSNVYGPGQFPEKLIPRFITECLRGRRMPVQGDGSHRRSFMYIEDTVRGLATVLVDGQLGEAYNVAGTEEWSVLEVARRVVACVKGSASNPLGKEVEAEHVCYVADRAYNDARYLLSNARLTALGWRQHTSFDEGLRRTVEWYRAHPQGSSYWSGFT